MPDHLSLVFQLEVEPDGFLVPEAANPTRHWFTPSKGSSCQRQSESFGGSPPPVRRALPDLRCYIKEQRSYTCHNLSLTSVCARDADNVRRMKCTLLCMSDTLPITEARARFGSLVRRASHARERITITDHGQPAAILINPQELADLEDALALAHYRARQVSGEVTGVPHEQVRAQLGLGHAS